MRLISGKDFIQFLVWKWLLPFSNFPVISSGLTCILLVSVNESTRIWNIPSTPGDLYYWKVFIALSSRRFMRTLLDTSQSSLWRISVFYCWVDFRNPFTTWRFFFCMLPSSTGCIAFYSKTSIRSGHVWFSRTCQSKVLSDWFVFIQVGTHLTLFQIWWIRIGLDWLR